MQTPGNPVPSNENAQHTSRDSTIRWLGFIAGILFAITGVMWILAGAQMTSAIWMVGSAGILLLLVQTILVVRGMMGR